MLNHNELETDLQRNKRYDDMMPRIFLWTVAAGVMAFILSIWVVK